jgi:hypothetical protein
VYNCVTINPVCKDVWGKGCLVMYVRPARVFVLTVSIPHGFRFLYVCVCVRARASVFMLRGTQWPLVLCFFLLSFCFCHFKHLRCCRQIRDTSIDPTLGGPM